MNDPPNDWNPEDGPRPTADELDDARRLAEALADPRRPPPDGDTAELVATALRVRATAHPDAAASRAVADRALAAVLAQAQSPWMRTRRRWLAVAAVLLATGAGIGLSRPRTPPRGSSAVTRDAGEEFAEALGAGAGSAPVTRIYETRMRSYREVLLHGRRSP